MCKEKFIYVFCDVLEFVIVVVGYMKIIFLDNESYFGFVLGKVKFVFIYGYLILRLELCVVVLVVEIVCFIVDYLFLLI